MSKSETPEQRAKRLDALRAWKKAHPEAVRAQKKRYAETHPEKIRAHKREVQRRRRDRYEAETGYRAPHIRPYNVIYAIQRCAKRVAEAGREPTLACELCGELAPLQWDHCHECGKFRGWLCRRCNLALGAVKDDPEFALRLVEFLRSHSHAQTA